MTPIDDETRAELDKIRREVGDALADLRRAGTPTKREEAAADLDSVLRREGYSFTRRELDEFVKERNDRAIREAVDRRLAEIEAEKKAEEEGEEEGRHVGEEEEGGEGGEEKDDGKPKGRRRTKTGAGNEEDDEWQ